MTARHRAWLAVHGGIIILIALLLGLLAVTDTPVDGLRSWRSAHQTLVLFGVWLLATAGAGSVLQLRSAEARGLVWALVIGAYAMAVTLSVRASTGVTGFQPGGSVPDWVAFLSNAIVVLASVVAALLTLAGALAALRHPPSSGAT